MKVNQVYLDRINDELKQVEVEQTALNNRRTFWEGMKALALVTNKAPKSSVTGILSLPVATVGIMYSHTLASNVVTDEDNDVLTYTYEGAPSWLSGKGLTIEGIPDKSGKVSLSLIVDDGQSSVTILLELSVEEKPLKLYGEPRVLASNNFNSHKLYAGKDKNGSWLPVYLESFQIRGKDAFVLRGIDISFTPVAGFVPLTSGVRSGMSEPNVPRPEGYRMDYFEGDKRVYWILEDGPDRVYVDQKPTDTKPPITPIPKTDVINDMTGVYGAPSYRTDEVKNTDK